MQATSGGALLNQYAMNSNGYAYTTNDTTQATKFSISGTQIVQSNDPTVHWISSTDGAISSIVVGNDTLAAADGGVSVTCTAAAANSIVCTGGSGQTVWQTCTTYGNDLFVGPSLFESDCTIFSWVATPAS